MDGLFSYVDVLPKGRLERTRRINGCPVDTYFLVAVAWLELGSVFTLSHVDLGIVVTTTWSIYFDADLGLVAVEMGEMFSEMLSAFSKVFSDVGTWNMR